GAHPLTGPAGLSLSASNMVVRVKRGLDLSTYPAGVPTTIAVPAVTTAAPQLVTVAGANTTTIILPQTLVLTSSIVVTSTPGSGGAATTLVLGTDYALGTAPGGHVTIIL